jgi:dTDP-4-dehydrorhamnose reductase
MRVLILGHKGMWGKEVLDVLRSRNVEVGIIEQTITHQFLFDNYHGMLGYDFIVNCIGKIPQTSKDFSINYQLPIWLEELSGRGCKIIEAGTDCTFSGNIGEDEFYKLYSGFDAESTYGISKIRMEKFVRMCDPTRHKIIKTSIIGHDAKNSSLLSWFLSHKDGDEVSGYLNHYWNGITTLEWAELCYQLIINWAADKDYCQIPDFKHYIQVGTYPLSKYDMLGIFNRLYKRYIKVNPITAHPPCNRCLYPYWHMGTLEDQIKKLIKKYA